MYMLNQVKNKRSKNKNYKFNNIKIQNFYSSKASIKRGKSKVAYKETCLSNMIYKGIYN